MSVPTDAFDTAPEFKPSSKGYVVTTATFDAYVAVGATSVTITVELPMLDAVVVGESVAEVVEDGWFDTFRRRVEDVDGLTPADIADPTVERRSESVIVETSVSVRDGHAASDALAVVNFVEGTWFGGIIPGYEYEDRVRSVREAASEMGGSDDVPSA
jgi:hypothetical protein